MKAIMAKSPHDTSFSFSRRYFNWRKKIVEDNYDQDDDEEILTFNSSSHFDEDGLKDHQDEHHHHHHHHHHQDLSNIIPPSQAPIRKKLPLMSVSKLRSAFALFSIGHSRSKPSTLGTKVVGTLFGFRRGHVHFAFQEDAKLSPAFMIELATPTSVLVREMASGLVRIALECERKPGKKAGKLLEEPLWRTYCNGKKCGYAMRRDCGPEEWGVLKAVGPISMGAGVLPGNEGGGSELGELMYMRARFERVVGSKDSEAFYMMNPDGSGGPELSVYLLRV